MESDFVQCKNPRTGRYVKVDRRKAKITHKKTDGSYKNIVILKNKK